MKLKNTILKSPLCNYSGVYIILKGKKTTVGNVSAAPVTKNKQVMKQQTIYCFFFEKTKTYKNLYRV